MVDWHELLLPSQHSLREGPVDSPLSSLREAVTIERRPSAELIVVVGAHATDRLISIDAEAS